MSQEPQGLLDIEARPIQGLPRLFCALPLGDFPLQCFVRPRQLLGTGLCPCEQVIHADQEPGQDTEVTQLFHEVGRIKHRIKELKGERHKHDLGHQADDERKHDPVFGRVMFLGGLAHVPDEREEKKRAGHKLLRSAKDQKISWG